MWFTKKKQDVDYNMTYNNFVFSKIAYEHKEQFIIQKKERATTEYDF